MENELPEGWVWTTLEQVTAPVRITVLPKEYPHLPYVGMEHVEAETMKLLGTGPASELKSNAARFWPRDVLYGRLRSYLNKVLRPDFEGLCSPEFLVFPQSVNLNSRYLQYFFNSWKFRDFATHLNEGDRPRVDWDQLKIYGFPLAPMPEQHRIVAAIEQQFSRLDAAITSLQHARAKLKRQRAAILKAAVEGTLTKGWRAQYPASETAKQLLQRILGERRAKWEAEQLAKMQAKGVTPKDDKWKDAYKEPEPPDIRNLPELPTGWSYAYLYPLLSIMRKGITTGPFGSLLKKYEHRSEGVPVVGIENIAAMHFVSGSKIHITLDKAEELSRYDAQPGDILVSRSGTVGEVCVVPDYLGEARISTNLMRISLAPFGMLPQFFCLLFNGSPIILDQLSELCRGSTREFLNQNILSSIIFPLPPLAEQQQIVSEVEARLSIIAQTELEVAANLKRAERLRQTILAEAFAGRLVPQDQHDEPASVLLERIRQEREERDGMQKKGRAGNGHARATVKVSDEPVKIDVEEMEQVALWESVGG